MRIFNTFSNMLNGNSSAGTNVYSDSSSAVYDSRSMHTPVVTYEYDGLNRMFYFRAGYATICMPEELMRMGGQYVVGRQHEKRQKYEAKWMNEGDKTECSDDCTTPEVVCNDIKNTAKPKMRIDLCSKFLYEK